MLTRAIRNCVFVAAAFIGAGVLSSDVSAKEWKPTAAYMATADRIAQLQHEVQTLSKSETAEKLRRLEELEKLGDEIEQSWRTSDVESYARLTFKVACAIGGYDYGTKGTTYLAKSFVMRALEKADEMSLEVECRLVNGVGGNVDAEGKPLKGEAWTALREKQARLWLHAWQRIEKTIDKTWDPDDLPQMNVTPPHGASGEAGMAPSAIKDPQLRAEYEAAIEANRKKNERYHQQSTAAKLKKYWVPEAERFLIGAYMKPPAANAELEALLNTYISDADRRARLLKAVETGELPADLILPRPSTTQAAKAE
jgi:hypothetical protein